MHKEEMERLRTTHNSDIGKLKQEQVFLTYSVTLALHYNNLPPSQKYLFVFPLFFQILSFLTLCLTHMGRWSGRQGLNLRQTNRRAIIWKER